MRKWILGVQFIVFPLFFWLTWGVFSFASIGDRDPIGDTQTKPVPVTQELLTREGEPGPASPTFKMQDTAKFLVKKPYDQAVKEYLDRLPKDEQDSALLDEWFSWDEKEAVPSETEPIDKK